MTHVRLAALRRICELIEEESGLRVFRGRQVIGKDIPKPLLNISEDIRPGSERPSSDKVVRQDTCEYLLSGYIDNNNIEYPMDEGYECIAAIEKAFARIMGIDRKNGDPIDKENYRLGGLISAFSYFPPICHNPPDDVQSHSYFYIKFSFTVLYEASAPEVSMANKWSN